VPLEQQLGEQEVAEVVHTERELEAIRRQTLLEIDLGHLESGRRAANTFLESGRPPHMRINNAGLAGQQLTTNRHA
jgi:hypothetical protein